MEKNRGLITERIRESIQTEWSLPTMIAFTVCELMERSLFID